MNQSKSMLQQIIDLHIHSKYSRACSPSLELPKIAATCDIRGVDIVATGDFTHPKWFEHIKESLVEENDGVYKLQITNNKLSRLNTGSRTVSGQINTKYQIPNTRFILGTELACIKKHKGETRRLHLCVFTPNIEVAGKFNKKLEDRGFNLRSDGRPILGMTAKELLECMLEADERMIMIPAHAWTPWFGIFGSKGGYNSLEEAFEELTPHIFAIETGLSSDPLMNWRWSKLDNISLVSNSDAHSLNKIGREANVLQFDNEKDITYQNIFEIIKESSRVKPPNGGHAAGKFLHTIEFYPEEGKYHYDGHRDCKFVCSPAETKKLHGICPKCKKSLVIGVMNRVEELADRSEKEAQNLKNKVPYKNLVPLSEIIADVLDVGVNTKTVKIEYDNLIKHFKSEFNILLNASLAEIEKAGSKNIAVAIDKVKKGDVYIRPGYDGEFGVVKVFKEGEKRSGLRQIGLDLDI